ncbi:MAG: hypothetical protein HY040_05945 [Planctomycetes bacterium]|nr:hypothetical protein [Planctomycetota bacterium]
MPLADVLPSIQSLPKADKFRLVQLLIADLARADGVLPFEPGASYPVYTPLDQHLAASQLSAFLDIERAKPE